MIAEGLETLEHGQLLLRMGCEVAQGYYFAQPMPAAEVPAWAAGFDLLNYGAGAGES